MSNAKSIVEAAVFAALDQAVTLATVYQDVPQDAEGDLVIIGDMKSSRMPGKEESPDRIVIVTIVGISFAEERAPLLAMQAQCDAALDGVTLEAPGWTLRGQFLDDDAVLAEDGSRYDGVASYQFTALAD